MTNAFARAAVELAANNMSCNIPNAMVEEEIDRQMNQFAYQLQMSGMKMEDYAKMMGGDMGATAQLQMRPMAENTVKAQHFAGRSGKTGKPGSDRGRIER